MTPENPTDTPASTLDANPVAVDAVADDSQFIDAAELESLARSAMPVLEEAVAEGLLKESVIEAVQEAIGEPVKAADEEQGSYFLVKRQNVKATMTPISSADGFNPAMEVVGIPSTMGAAIQHSLSQLGTAAAPAAGLWSRMVESGIAKSYEERDVVPALSREDSLWTNSPENASKAALVGHRLKIAAGNNKVLTGDRALLAVFTHMQMGTIFRAPLWNSGIWVAIKAPTEDRLLELARQITAAKLDLGRSTYGASFSNHMVYTAQLFAELVMEQLHATTAENSVNLMDVISVQDFMPLVWAIACAVYPNGFSYRRSCTAGADTCNHVLEERLNVSRLLWVDEKSLTAEQKSHMSNTKNSWASLESIQKYQSQFTAAHGERKVLRGTNGSELEVTLKVPSMTEFMSVGNRWVSDISKMVLEALGVDASIDARNAYMRDLSRASSARQYLHWVKALHVDSDVVEDREALESIFTDVISVDNQLREQFMQHVQEFTNKTLTSIVGIPNYSCPKCKRPQHLVEGAEEGADPATIIPLEGVTVFFDLLFQKIALIRDRV